MRAACEDNYSNLDPFRLVETHKSTRVNTQLFVQSFKMSKHSRHPPGFYASPSDIPDRALGMKFRPMAKPAVMGVFIVERVVAKRYQGSKAEYFVQCQKENRIFAKVWVGRAICLAL